MSRLKTALAELKEKCKPYLDALKAAPKAVKFATMYPDHCRQTDDNEQGGLTFEIKKGRLSFRLTAPYSAERRKIYSKNAKEKGIKGSADYSFEIKKIA